MARIMQGWELLAVEWSFVALTLAMVTTRLYIQLKSRRRIHRELFVLSAWLLFVATASCDTIITHFGAYNLTHGLTTIPSQQILALKVEFAQGFFYKTSIYCCKFSLLFFYSDLTPRHMYSKTWLLVQATSALCIVGLVVHFLLNSLKCEKVRWNWSVEHHAKCRLSQVYFGTSWAFHLGTDILVYLIPFQILQHMRSLSFHQKLGAALMFCIGFINIVTAALLLAFSLYSTSNLILQGFINTIYVIQQATAILIVCLPQMRLFFKKAAKDAGSRRGSGYYWGRGGVAGSISVPAAVQMPRRKSGADGEGGWRDGDEGYRGR